MINPFDITFGKPPEIIINRFDINNEVVESFNNNNKPYSLYILCGPRGSGKTVTLTSIANHFKKADKWIVIDLNPHQDLEEQFAASLYQKGKVKQLFLKKDFNFSFKGIGFTISGDNPITNTSNLISVMLEHLTKKGYHILLTIDEVNNNNFMKIFAHSFQSYMREGYYVSLIMTGLYENISNLENDEGLTFLYRAPKIYLPPLNTRAIAYSYAKTLNMSDEDAIEAALVTKGYAFSYQLLGYILFRDQKNKVDNEVLKELDVLLDERSYSKIYSELTNKEKDILNLVANEKTTNKEIKDILNMKDGSLSTYKNILSKKGIIDVSERGVISFLLPRFKEFILFHSNW